MNKDVLDTLRDYKDKCKELENINDKLSNSLLSAENKIYKYKEVIDKAINNSQYWIDYYTRLNSDERIELRLQENIDILNDVSE